MYSVHGNPLSDSGSDCQCSGKVKLKPWHLTQPDNIHHHLHHYHRHRHHDHDQRHHHCHHQYHHHHHYQRHHHQYQGNVSLVHNIFSQKLPNYEFTICLLVPYQ